MARTRMIKPAFYDDETLAEVSVHARYLYIGLWCHFDRSGLIEHSPRFFKKCVFPYDDKITIKHVSAYVDELIKTNRLVPCEFSGKKFLFCKTFTIHQHFHHLESARYKYDTSTVQVSDKSRSNPTSSTSASTSVVVGGDPGLNGGVHPKTTPPPIESVPPPIQAGDVVLTISDPLLLGFLRRGEVGRATLTGWLQKYGDPDWLNTELFNAANEWGDIPDKKVFAKRLGNWLDVGWKRKLEKEPKAKVRGHV